MGEENVFYCWAGFEPSKSAIFGKKHVTALGSASCCKLGVSYVELEDSFSSLWLQSRTGCHLHLLSSLMDVVVSSKIL